MNTLYLKHLLVATPLEPLAHRVRHWLGASKRRANPELREIHLEEGRIHEAMARLVREDSNCIDVGAHIGSTLSQLISLAPRGQHWAFEAVEEKAGWLRKKFPKVTVKHLALTDSEGEIVFHVNLSRPGYSGIHNQGDDKDQWTEVVVPTAPLDAVIPADTPIHFIKIDVEGAEAVVLKGARELLARSRPAILFESAPRPEDPAGDERRVLFDLLTSYGYGVYFVKDYLEGGDPTTWERFDASHQYPFQALNYLALPKAEE